ncbi:hypothetical protein ACAG26_14115 [Mycobacterium sp. pUA109]|uniref:hypothetical protein n=1 Tax=Mycobacterium sp. pUA109 TaxID=3238982 RepID=UPI00351B4FBA
MRGKDIGCCEAPRPVLISYLAVVTMAFVGLGGLASADPADPPPPILPEFIPTASSFVPQFPYPYDQTRKSVTDADINAEREMCQWFKGQYHDLRNQMDRFGFNLLQANNDWTAGTIQAQADNVATNVENAVAFLTPRAEALTISQDFAGDMYFPLYQGEPFYRLWQELSNVGVGIRARNTAWVYGPSQQRVKRWASQIERSRICDQ